MMFTCHVLFKKRIHASLYHCLSKFASTFVHAVVEEKLTPLNSLYFSPPISLKISANRSNNVFISLLMLIHESNRRLSKLASIFVLALVEGIYMPLNPWKFSTPTFMKVWRIDAKRRKIMLMFPESYEKYLFGRVKTRGLEQVTMEKKGYY